MKLTRSFRMGLYTLCAFLIAAVLFAAFVWNSGVMPTALAQRTEAAVQRHNRKRPAPDMSHPGQVGWLTVPGTDIDAPVMQAEDNDYYLRRNEAGKDDAWGCYFMDYECSGDSQNVIVYGHSLDDDANAPRFSQLKRYLETGMTKKNKIIALYYDGAWREYEVFSAGYADADQDRLAIVADPQVDIAAQLVTAAQKRSEITTNVEVSAADALLTLCTCTSDTQTRFVVTAVRR